MIEEKTTLELGKVKRVEYVENHSGDGYSIDEAPRIFADCDVRFVKRRFGKWTMKSVYINGEMMKSFVASARMRKGTLRIVACVGN